jgi:SAM-dependent methyltransferase
MAADYRLHFKRQADRYARWIAPMFRPAHAYFESLIQAMPSGSRILDIACGDGRMGAAAAALGHIVVGIDSSGELLAHARARSDRAVWVTADAHSLPLQSDFFDAVVCNLGVQFFADPPRALREMCRVVQRGASVVVASQAYVPVPIGDFFGESTVPPDDSLFSSCGLTVTGARFLESEMAISERDNLVAAWCVMPGPWADLATLPESLLYEFADEMLQRNGGSMSVRMVFHVVESRKEQ